MLTESDEAVWLLALDPDSTAAERHAEAAEAWATWGDEATTAAVNLARELLTEAHGLPIPLAGPPASYMAQPDQWALRVSERATWQRHDHAADDLAGARELGLLLASWWSHAAVLALSRTDDFQQHLDAARSRWLR